MTWPQRACLALVLALTLGGAAAMAGALYLAPQHAEMPPPARPVVEIPPGFTADF